MKERVLKKIEMEHVQKWDRGDLMKTTAGSDTPKYREN